MRLQTGLRYIRNDGKTTGKLEAGLLDNRLAFFDRSTDTIYSPEGVVALRRSGSKKYPEDIKEEAPIQSETTYTVTMEISQTRYGKLEFLACKANKTVAQYLEGLILESL